MLLVIRLIAAVGWVSQGLSGPGERALPELGLGITAAVVMLIWS